MVVNDDGDLVYALAFGRTLLCGARAIQNLDPAKEIWITNEFYSAHGKFEKEAPDNTELIPSVIKVDFDVIYWPTLGGPTRAP